EHDVGGKQQRERNGQRDDEAGPPASKQDEQHKDDENAAFDEVVYDGVQRALNQVGPVVENFQLDVRGQRFLDLGDALFDSLYDRAAVFAQQHHDDGGHDLAAAIAGGGALASKWGDDDLSYIANESRQIAGAAADHDFFNVFGAV